MPLIQSIIFSADTPAPAAGHSNILFQSDGGTPVANISAFDPNMVGDSGSGGWSGNVPAPAAGDAAAGKFLKADGTWAVPSVAFSSGSDANGYWVKDSVGHIHQWGTSVAGTDPQTISFPTPFTNAASISVALTPANYGASATRNPVYLGSAPDIYTFTAQTDSTTAAFHWQADGY
jgi:hypothetical protein